MVIQKSVNSSIDKWVIKTILTCLFCLWRRFHAHKNTSQAWKVMHAYKIVIFVV